MILYFPLDFQSVLVFAVLFEGVFWCSPATPLAPISLSICALQPFSTTLSSLLMTKKRKKKKDARLLSHIRTDDLTIFTFSSETKRVSGHCAIMKFSRFALMSRNVAVDRIVSWGGVRHQQTDLTDECAKVIGRSVPGSGVGFTSTLGSNDLASLSRGDVPLLQHASRISDTTDALDCSVQSGGISVTATCFDACDDMLMVQCNRDAVTSWVDNHLVESRRDGSEDLKEVVALLREGKPLAGESEELRIVDKLRRLGIDAVTPNGDWQVDEVTIHALANKEVSLVMRSRIWATASQLDEYDLPMCDLKPNQIFSATLGKHLFRTSYRSFQTRLYCPRNVLTGQEFPKRVESALRRWALKSGSWWSVFGSAADYRACGIEVLDQPITINCIDEFGEPHELISAYACVDPQQALSRVYGQKEMI